MIPPHMIPTFALVGCFIIFMLTLSAVLVAVATNEDVQKALEELENEENNDPSSSPASSSSSPSPSPSSSGPPAFQYPIGTTVMCEENDPLGENNISLYRVVDETGKLRNYPDTHIAEAWDDDWDDEEYIEDCAGLTLGDPMSYPPGTEYHCVANDKDFLQGKSSRMYANRNYNELVTKCQQETNVVDCQTGDHLQQRTNGGDDVVDEFLECIWVEKD